MQATLMNTPDYTDEEIAEALIATGGVQKDAAKLIGCDPTTIWRRAKRSDLIQSAIDLGLEELADEAHVVVRDGMKRKERILVYEGGKPIGWETIDEPDKVAVDAAKWALARLKKGRFSERQELTGADGAELFKVEFPVRQAE